MLLKKGNIVMLKSDENVIEIVTEEGNTEQTFEIGSLVFNPKAEPSICRVKENDVYNPSKGYHKVNLCLFVESDLDVGDYILNNEEKSICFFDKGINDIYGNKLIACTDKSYELPKFSKKFLISFVKKQGINDSMVIYEEIDNRIVPKISKQNTVAIRRIKDNYTGVEVSNLFKTFIKDIYNNLNLTEAMAWIDKQI